MLLWSGEHVSYRYSTCQLSRVMAMKASAGPFLEYCPRVLYCRPRPDAKLRHERRPPWRLCCAKPVCFPEGKQGLAGGAPDSVRKYKGPPIIINKRSETSLTYC